MSVPQLPCPSVGLHCASKALRRSPGGLSPSSNLLRSSFYMGSPPSCTRSSHVLGTRTQTPPAAPASLLAHKSSSHSLCLGNPDKSDFPTQCLSVPTLKAGTMGNTGAPCRFPCLRSQRSALMWGSHHAPWLVSGALSLLGLRPALTGRSKGRAGPVRAALQTVSPTGVRTGQGAQCLLFPVAKPEGASWSCPAPAPDIPPTLGLPLDLPVTLPSKPGSHVWTLQPRSPAFLWASTCSDHPWMSKTFR